MSAPARGPPPTETGGGALERNRQTQVRKAGPTEQATARRGVGIVGGKRNAELPADGAVGEPHAPRELDDAARQPLANRPITPRAGSTAAT